jgi:hypothetical protein
LLFQEDIEWLSLGDGSVPLVAAFAHVNVSDNGKKTIIMMGHIEIDRLDQQRPSGSKR